MKEKRPSIIHECFVCHKYKPIRVGKVCNACKPRLIMEEERIVINPRDGSASLVPHVITYEEMLSGIQPKMALHKPSQFKPTYGEMRIEARQKAIAAQNSYRPPRVISIFKKLDRYGHYGLIASWLVIALYLSL